VKQLSLAEITQKSNFPDLLSELFKNCITQYGLGKKGSLAKGIESSPDMSHLGNMFVECFYHLVDRNRPGEFEKLGRDLKRLADFYRQNAKREFKGSDLAALNREWAPLSNDVLIDAVEHDSKNPESAEANTVPREISSKFDVVLATPERLNQLRRKTATAVERVAESKTLRALIIRNTLPEDQEFPADSTLPTLAEFLAGAGSGYTDPTVRRKCGELGRKFKPDTKGRPKGAKSVIER